MLFKQEFLDEYTRETTKVDECEVGIMDYERRLQAAKFQVEFYFGQTNYQKDVYLQSHESRDGWIDIKFINNFKKMKAFKLTVAEVFEMMQKSIVVDVKQDFWPNGDPIYLIRKKSLQMNK